MLSTQEKIAKQSPYSTRVFYPFRPFFTLAIGVSALSIGWAGIVPMGLAVWMGTSVITDDLALYPAFRINGFRNNLSVDIKQYKSKIGMAITLAGYIAGAIAASYILANAAWMAFFTNLIIAMECHITVLAICQILGAMTAHYFDRPALMGMFIGAVVAPYLPIVIPMAVDIYGLSILTGGFLATYLGKQVMRGLYYFKYGHSNADGYHFAHEENEMEVDQQRAEFFGVDKAVFTNLRVSLLKVIRGTNANTSYLGKVIGSGKACTDELKNILFLLMRAEDKSDKQALSALLVYTMIGTGVLSSDTDKRCYKELSEYNQIQMNTHSSQLTAQGHQDSGVAVALLKQNKAFEFSKLSPEERHTELMAFHKVGVQSCLARCDFQAEKEGDSSEFKDASQALTDAVDDFFIALKV